MQSGSRTEIGTGTCSRQIGPCGASLWFLMSCVQQRLQHIGLTQQSSGCNGSGGFEGLTYYIGSKPEVQEGNFVTMIAHLRVSGQISVVQRSSASTDQDHQIQVPWLQRGCPDQIQVPWLQHGCPDCPTHEGSYKKGLNPKSQKVCIVCVAITIVAGEPQSVGSCHWGGEMGTPSSAGDFTFFLNKQGTED